MDDVAGEAVALLDALLLVESSALRRGNLDFGRGLLSWLSSFSSVSESPYDNIFEYLKNFK